MPPPSSPPERPRARKPSGHPFTSALLNSYATRILLALSVSLGGLLALAHSPLHRLTPRSGWFHSAYQTDEPIPLESLRGAQEAGQQEAEQALLSTAALAGAAPPGSEEQGESGASEADEPQIARRPDTFQRAPILDPAHAPRVAGGFGQFYMRIAYPEEAQRRGIQGKLLLDFTVERDGYPSDIRVLRSLHPLCDSAAVRSLRVTRFVPGTRGGEIVRARMRLPVTFRLINPPGASTDSSLAANQ